MLSEKINELEIKIKALDEISGFKRSITEHNKIQKELETCKIEIEGLEKLITNISIDNNLIEQITDEQYIQYITEIKSLTEIFDKLEIDEQIQIYQNMMIKIKLCDNYLKSRKQEIIYIEKDHKDKKDK